jgi:hypothetical protein
MVHFQTKNPNFGLFLMENVGIFCIYLEYVKAIWCILGPFAILWPFCILFSRFGILRQKNLATLPQTTKAKRSNFLWKPIS